MMEELMAARLPESVKFALAVAVGSVHILEHVLGYVEGISPRDPILDAAVAVLVVALPIIYIMGVTLMYLYLAPPAAAARQRRALRRFADLARVLTLALLVALAAFLFLALADSLSPDSGGLRPT